MSALRQIFKGMCAGGSWKSRYHVRVFHNPENDRYAIELYDKFANGDMIVLDAATARELAEAILKEAGA